MVNSILLAAALICTEPKIVNQSQEPFGTDRDLNSLISAELGCKRSYPKQPCVSEFRKKDNNVYYVICGAKSEVN